MPRHEQWGWTIYLCAVMWISWWAILASVTPHYYQAPAAAPYEEYLPPKSHECETLREAELQRVENNTAKIIFGGWQYVDMSKQ